MSDCENDDQLYDVEKICGYQYKDGTHEFKVKWLGYEGKDSWEPLSNLACPFRIFEYFQDQHFQKYCESVETQTDQNELEPDSFITIFEKGTTKTYDTSFNYPEPPPSFDIQNIDIDAKTATVLLPGGMPQKVNLSELTKQYPSKVNQYFLDQANRKSQE